MRIYHVLLPYLRDNGLVIDGLSLIVFTSILVSCHQNKSPTPDYALPFMWMVRSAMIQTVSDIVSIISFTERHRMLLYVSSMLDFICGYAIAFCFCVFLYRFCRDPKEDNWLWRDIIVFAGLGFLAQSLATSVLIWQGSLVGYSRDATLFPAPLRVAVLYGFTLAVLFLSSFVVLTRRNISHHKKAVLFTYCLIPVVAVPFMLAGIQRSQSIVLVQTVLIYCHIFVQQGKDLAEMESELLNSRMETMLSQIQPHFLYNALSSCVSLCDDDPQLAKKTLLDFSRYLRANLDSLGKKEPIPFTKELEHTRTYLNIEQIRFGEKVRVEYDLQVTDFLLPALTLQPLAENAVKHGITMKREGGTVTIRSSCDENNYYVTVEDDGVGFEKLPEGKEHIGVRNIQGRLASMVGGTLVYESKINIGTKAVITLPKKGK